MGPSGIAALRSNIDHMGFDGASIFVSESAALSSEDQSNLDRLLLFPSSASTIQASSTSLLNDSQMGFVFLKHKAYNYDGESESSSTGVSQQQLLTGLFAKDSHVLDADGPPAVDGNNLFKEDKPARKAPSLPTNAKVLVHSSSHS